MIKKFLKLPLNKKITYIVLFYLCLAVAICIGVFCYTYYDTSVNNMLSNMDRQSYLLSQSVERQLEMYINITDNVFSNKRLMNILSEKDSGAYSTIKYSLDIQEFMQDISASAGGVQDMCFENVNGDMVAIGNLPREVVTYGISDIRQRIERDGTEPHLGAFSYGNEAEIVLGRKVMSVDELYGRSYNGIIYIFINADSIFKRYINLFGEKSRVYMVDEEKRILLDSTGKNVGKMLMAESYNRGGTEYMEIDGKKYYCLSSDIDDIGCKMIFAEECDEVTRPIRDVILKILAAMIVILLLLAFTVRFVSEGIAKPIRAISEEIDNIRETRFKKKLSEDVDEILYPIVKSYNMMIDTLDNLINKELAYLDLAIRNDAAEFMDFMNFHSHITAVEGAKTNSLTSRQAVNADSTLKKYGYYNKSLSLDESGIITQFKDGHEYSRDQQKVRAGYYVTVNAQNMANGVDRHYWYIVLQRGSAMSMFTEDGNGPYPEYNAVATTTDVLGVPEYLGEVNSLKGGAKGYAFNNKNNGRDIMVLWSENPVEFRFASNESVEVIDVMGKEETVAPTDGEITLTIADQPIFVRANSEFESEVYTPKKKAPKRENSIDRSKITKAQRVLLQQSYPKEVSEGAKTKGYQIDETGTELTLTVTNLNEEKMAGVVCGKAFDGWKLSDDEISVSLEPMSQQQFKLRLTPTDKVQYNVESAVRFVGMFDGEETTNCVTLVQMPKDGEYEWYCEFKEATDINEWIADESNIGGGAIGSKITLENANGGLKFNYDFDPATPDMWSFPSFEFNEIPDLTMTDGIIIRYEGTKDTAPDELLSRIIVKEESSGAAYFTIQGFYMEKGVHEVLIPWDRLVFQTGADPTFMLEKDNIATFSLGINNIRKVLDVPEYTILKIGAYVGARTEDKHGTIKCEYPKNGACISNSEKLVAIGKICDDDIKVERNKIRVYVDGFPAEHIIEGDEVKANIGELEAGEHTVKFNWECEDSAAYNEEVSFVADSGDKVFSDVAEEHWAADKIANLAARGVVSGDEDGTFRPDDNVTRAEYIKMLTTVLKFKNVYDKAGFTDVSAHDWFYDYVAAASEAGLFDGVYEGEFGADTVISREDMATFTYRALKAAGITLPNTNVKQIFLDKDEISSYAKTPINMLQQAGIVEGMENRKFLPSDGLTRAEAAKVLYEVIVYIL